MKRLEVTDKLPHARPQKLPTRSSELRCCQNLAEQVVQLLSNGCPKSRDSAQCRPEVADVGRIRLTFGHLGLKLVDVDQVAADFAGS